MPILSCSSPSIFLCILNVKPHLTKLLLLLICSTLCSPWLICPKFCLQIYSFTLSCSKGINIVIRIWLLQSLHSNILGKSAVVEGLCSTCSYDAICTFIKFKPRKGWGKGRGHYAAKMTQHIGRSRAAALVLRWPYINLFKTYSKDQ